MKMTRKVFASVVVAGAAMLLSGRATQAATILTNGSTVDGWTVTIPAGISLVADNTTGSTLEIEKFAAFPSDARLNIVFTQTSAGAASTIDITNENVTNLSGTNWTGFQFFLNGGASDNASESPTFGSVFAPPNGGASGVVYTNESPVGNNQVNYTGTQANGSTSIWGFGSDGDLIINANPTLGADGFAQIVTFGEQPTGGPGGGTSVPLPAAAWSSIAVLGALLVIGKRRAWAKM